MPIAKKIITGGQQLLNPIFLLKKIGLTEGMRIADLGCGTVGHFVIPAAHLVGDKGKVYGVDILKSALEGVSSRAKLEGLYNVETVWSDLEVYGGANIKAASLDIILLINILFQTKRHSEILREAVRLLKNFGKILVVDWKANKIPSFGPSSEHRIDKEKIIADVDRLGLRVIEEFEAGPYHLGIILKRK